MVEHVAAVKNGVVIRAPCFARCVHSYVQWPGWNQKVAMDCWVFLLGRFDDNFVFSPLQAVPRHIATFGSVTWLSESDIFIQASVERTNFERESHKYNFLERERVLKCFYPNMFAPRPRITCEGLLWPVCQCERKILVLNYSSFPLHGCFFQRPILCASFVTSFRLDCASIVAAVSIWMTWSFYSLHC